MHGVAQLCCRHKVSLQGRNRMLSGNLDGGAEERDTALVTRVELTFGLMTGFFSQSHMVTNIALHFGRVMMNTVLDSGKKNSKFLDLRPTTPKHEMFYHFKSHLSM